MIENTDAIRQGCNVVEIVSHENDWDAHRLTQIGQLRMKLAPCSTINGGERLIEQEDGGIAREGARDRDALLLPTREGCRASIFKAFEVNLREESMGTCFPLADREMTERSQDIARSRHVGKKRVALEDKANASPIGQHVDRAFRIEPDRAAANHPSVHRPIKSGDGSQDRGFTAAGRTDQRQQLPLGAGQLHV